ncbi:FAD-dependent oxidoreductase [[Mycobacterium] burgundiense]|uniref:ferredoxin--NADP(+) reductase n=1 Tax=[Mycobacterium] burgundiense TaxID=3064286 RepID=A0ABM9LHJ8_9MYCO|nr:FAD-dependent oxidoreductase [Mycolicibacterium sp. MU0053]CAJ1499173.1 FAD-dependent oxidoreductase [Mycolicibacterium sp. MU0053]
MTFVITQNCCNDASCVPVCPVDCIRPVPSTDGTGSTMLYIDPASCVDCGACEAECPVGAIYFEDDVPVSQTDFLDINADYFTRNPLAVRAVAPEVGHRAVEPGALRVAIVGTGPAACYAAAELMRTDGVEVNMFERLPTPFGLIRSGVAPDHQRTKGVVSIFEPALAHPNLRCYFNVTVGDDISHQELLEHHHAVIYGVGASSSRKLGIGGEELPGNHAAAEVVGWYNGHPDHADDVIDMSARRAVIIGNGNVALDVARVLLSATEQLAATDIAEHALRHLAESEIEEVVIVGRRGVADAAFSVGEFLALGELSGVDIVMTGETGDRPDSDFDGALKFDTAERYARRTPTGGNKRLVFRFGTTPVEVVGADRVEGLRVTATHGGAAADDEVIETGLVLRSVGYRGTALPGVPFDTERGVVPNERGRVTEGGDIVPGVYVTGWIKRGPRGFIGTNRTCAQETVAALIDDFRGGRLPEVAAPDAGIDAVLEASGVAPIDWAGWQRIDEEERRRGGETSKPRVKLVAVPDLVTAARE